MSEFRSPSMLAEADEKRRGRRAVKILAHRCGPVQAAENTLEAAEVALKAGADSIECDVQLSSDGAPMIFHDASLLRMTGRNERLGRLERSRLAGLKVAGKHRIPHIDEMLELLKAYPRAECYFDLHDRSPGLAGAVATSILRSGLSPRCFILGFYSQSRNILARIKNEFPRVRIALMPEVPWSLTSRANRVQAESLCIGWDSSWHQILFRAAALCVDLAQGIRAAQDAGLEISGGIADSPEDMRWLVQAGVTGIWTNNVTLAVQELRGTG